MSGAVEAAFEVAAQAHTRQQYGNTPYATYLREVLAVALDFWPLDEDTPERVQVAAVLHDIVDTTAHDPRKLYEQFGLDVARMVMLMSEPLRGNRRERLAGLHYQLRSDPEAAYVRLCARLANVRRIDDSETLKLYQREQETFVKPLAGVHPEMLWSLYGAIHEALKEKRDEV